MLYETLDNQLNHGGLVVSSDNELAYSEEQVLGWIKSSEDEADESGRDKNPDDRRDGHSIPLNRE